MSKNTALTLVFFICVGFSQVQAQTLKEAVRQAVTTHPNMLLNRAQTMTAKQGIFEAKGAYYPNVDINGAFGREWTDTPIVKDLEGDTAITLNRQEFSLAIVQNLFAGGAITGEVERNFFAFKSQDYKTLSVASDLALDVTEAYLDVLLQTQLVSLAQYNLNEHRRLFKLIEERSSAGISRAAEFDQASSRVALARANLISSEANLREAKIHYRKLVGTMPRNLISPIFPKNNYLPKTLDQAIEEGLATHPSVQASLADVKEAQAQRSVANSAFAPKVDGVLSTSRNKNLDGLVGKNEDAFALIRVSYNVFKGGADLSRMRKTAFQVQESIETRMSTILDMQESLALAYNSWENSGKRAKVLEQYAISTKKTKISYFEQFQIGQRSLLDLLNTQNEETSAKKDYLTAKNDEILARYRILNGTGRLIPYINHAPDHQAGFRPIFEIDTLPDSKSIMIPDEGPPDLKAKPVKIPDVVIERVVGALRAKKSLIPSIPKDAKILRPTSIIPVIQTTMNYVVQAVALTNQNDAERIKKILIGKDFDANIEVAEVKGTTWYRILVGPFATKVEAESAEAILQEKQHIKGMIRKIA